MFHFITESIKGEREELNRHFNIPRRLFDYLDYKIIIIKYIPVADAQQVYGRKN
jgi:hypothetical protein